MSSPILHQDLMLPNAVERSRAITREEQRAAALAIAARCTDVDDCRELLDMLGLREELRG